MDEAPNQFRKVETETETTTQTINPEPDNKTNLAPLAIGLGILLIIGGIYLGLTSRKEKIGTLPAYSPVVVTPLAKISSPSPQLTDDSHDTGNTVAVVPTETGDQTTDQGVVKGTSTQKKTTNKTSTKVQIQSPLPIFTPSLPLPEFSPVVALPDFQPQFVNPEPSVKQTDTISLVVPGTRYQVEVTKGSVVLTVLNSAKAQGLIFQSTNFGSLGELITSINGQSQSSSKFWTYTVNGTCANKGVSFQTISDGATVTFVLTTSEDSPCK
jgi:hypothetical protein